MRGGHPRRAVFRGRSTRPSSTGADQAGTESKPVERSSGNYVFRWFFRFSVSDQLLYFFSISDGRKLDQLPSFHLHWLLVTRPGVVLGW